MLVITVITPLCVVSLGCRNVLRVQGCVRECVVSPIPYVLTVTVYDFYFRFRIWRPASRLEAQAPAAPRARLTDLAHLCVHKQERHHKTLYPLQAPVLHYPLRYCMIYFSAILSSRATCTQTRQTDRQRGRVQREFEQTQTHALQSRHLLRRGVRFPRAATRLRPGARSGVATCKGW